MSRFMFYFDVGNLVVRQMETFPLHSGNDDCTIGVRDIECSGQGPAFFADRRRLGNTELEALQLSQDILEQRDATILHEIDVLRKQRERISELRTKLKEL